METIFRIPNREIAMAAFESLRHEGKKDAALKLAGALLKHTYIPLGIGDTDWEIDTALRKYGGEPVTGYGYTAYCKRLLNYILCIRFFSGMHSIVSASQFPYTNLSQGCH